MKHIEVQDLYPQELEMLEFNLDVAGHTEEEKQYVYANLFRDENDVAYYPSSNRQKLIALYIS